MTDPTPAEIVEYMGRHVRCPICTEPSCSVDWPLVLVRQDADGTLIATNGADCRLCGWHGLFDSMEPLA